MPPAQKIIYKIITPINKIICTKCREKVNFVTRSFGFPRYAKITLFFIKYFSGSFLFKLELLFPRDAEYHKSDIKVAKINKIYVCNLSTPIKPCRYYIYN